MGKFDQRAEEFSLLVGAHDSARRVEELPLSAIIPDPDNPRRDFDEAELKELAASIEARGVLQPITVLPANGEGRYVIRMGERRYRASLAAGRTTIPAIVAGAGEGVASLADQIVENDQRADLTARELALGIERMLAGGMTQGDIATALGRSKQFVSLYAAFGDMEPYLRDAIDKAPIRVLYDLHRAAKKHPHEVRAFVRGFAETGTTLAAGNRFIASLKVPPEQPAPASATPVAAATAPKAKGRAGGSQPSARLASPVKVTVGTRTGRLVLPERVQVIFDDGEEGDVPVTDLSFD
ncbi:chromosome partitioning protein, ParB family [Sphingobium sp. AP50]|uniref:ParB/RepB/Spo0J family partition protein n=1 Tax=Sphingobium sp. AP50 TaxID=1884369 RepID=UPI0008CFA4AB|nr:ParB/RepB/Spo0J family partition protein [Sphingobium sp. AP50]SEJ80719.1 chromosome partitioning protein, ParB family [Sphingobium sp. AP50]